jgi:hypothetical protein
MADESLAAEEPPLMAVGAPRSSWPAAGAGGGGLCGVPQSLCLYQAATGVLEAGRQGSENERDVFHIPNNYSPSEDT